MEACSGVWNIAPEHNVKHPATFPLKLAERVVNLLSFEGDMVLDPFVGLGTTAVACAKWKRNFIGFDISSEYVEMANKRVRPWLEQQKLVELAEEGRI